jgi:hypothetical protein
MRCDSHNRFRETPSNIAKLQANVIKIADIVYSPLTLLLVRLYRCDDAGVTVDPTVSCGGGGHIVALLFTIPLALLVGVGTPLLVYRVIEGGVVTNDTLLHRQYIERKWKEAQAKINNDWNELHLSVHYRYTRPHSYHRVHVMTVKSLLILINIFAAGRPTDIALHAKLQFYLLFFWFSYLVIRPLYAGARDYWLSLALFALPFLNSVYNLFISFGVKSPFLIRSRVETAVFTYYSLTLLLVVMIKYEDRILQFWNSKVLKAKPVASNDDAPPVDVDPLQLQAIHTLRKANSLRSKINRCPASIVPYDQIMVIIGELEVVYNKLYVVGHHLTPTVREHLAQAKENMVKYESISVLKTSTNPLYQELPSLPAKLAYRAVKLMLIGRRWRRVLLKILAARILFLDRVNEEKVGKLIELNETIIREMKLKEAKMKGYRKVSLGASKVR